MDAEPAGLLGRLALHYKMVTREQLTGALQLQQRTPNKPLETLLVELGLLSEAQRAQLLRAQEQYRQQRGPKPQAKPTAGAAVHPPPVPERARPEAPAKAPAKAPPPPPPPVKAAPDTAAGAASGKLKWLHRVLTHAVATRATDVHLHAGTQVRLRLRGTLTPMSKEVLTPDQARSTLQESLDAEQRDTLHHEGEVEFAYEVPHVGRFRASVYKQHGGLCGVFHYIPADPPNLDDLGLPKALARLCSHRNGLLLVSGPAGSGKTSTMAALIAFMNEERDDHILSLEDPIEFRHTSKRCIVNQREVGRHTHSFRGALQSALREDPDVICIGELRDHETISLALSAAETGHLVIGTLHTLGAIRTVNRIIGSYPPAQQGQIRAMLSESLRGVISQKLLPSADGAGMTLAYELLLVNQAAGNLIRENRTFQLASIIQTGRQQGMQSLDDSLMELVRAGQIGKELARAHANNPGLFQ